jgi:hypothetical protein
MALVLIMTKVDEPSLKELIPIERKLLLGNSIYCDVVLNDKSIGSIQCQIHPAVSGHLIVTNLNKKVEIRLNKSKLKKSAMRVDDIVSVGAYFLKIDSGQLTEDEWLILDTEYEEFV